MKSIKMSNEVINSGLTVATLGRPFQLGMLYDCRSDKIITGVTLWDNSVLAEKNVQNINTADFEITASDTMHDKSFALDVNVELKLSFLGGLIDVSGAAKYLENRTNSNNHERVTLKYKCTTRSETMTMNQLGKGKIQHPEVFDHDTATHVVTGITYGGNTFFVFDREKSSESSDKHVEGHLHAMIKKIPSIKIDGKGDVDLTDEEKKQSHNLTCRYFGDFRPEENPSTFEEAVRLYKEIPKCVGKDGSKAVPVKAHLYPLSLLDSKASCLVRDISTHLIKETENVLEDLYEYDVICNDLINCKAVQKFRGIRAEIQNFKSLLATYKLGFQKELSQLLPPIRGGGKEETELADLLKRKQSSPFSNANLNAWLEEKKRQVKILSQYVSSFSQIKFESEPGDFEAMVLSPKYTHNLCFSILMPKRNRYLAQMSKYIGTKQCEDEVEIKEKLNNLSVNKNEDEHSMMQEARHFRDFYQANKDNPTTSFIVREEASESTHFQAKIRYYVNGKLELDDYEIPEPPCNVASINEEITHQSCVIQWEKPLYGERNISKYKIVCENVSEDSQVITEWTDLYANILRATVTGLSAGCEYELSVQSICDAGVSLPCKSGKPFKTRPTNPPGKPEVFQVSNCEVLIKWTKPSIIGPLCAIEKYDVKQQEEGLYWQSNFVECQTDLSMKTKLRPNSASKFQVYCDCGDSGTSLGSEVSDDFVIKMSAQELTKMELIEKSTLLVSGDMNIFQPNLILRGSDKQNGLEKYDFGSRKDVVPEKVIMVVGATGSGKTTLINALTNYIFGVNWKDNNRFKLISEVDSANQAKSQTSKITSYTLHHQSGFRFPYTLTIIDTPGFGDVQGIQRDKEITEQIRSFFTKDFAGTVDRLDAVGFVAQSSLPRLTATQSYIFGQILSLFGKDIKDNIFLFLTFADGQKPQVLSGINEADLPYKKFFKFNNSALFVNNKTNEGTEDDTDDEDDGNFDTMFWKMGEKSFKTFLKELRTIESKSLTLTKDVLNERSQLEIHIVGIRQDIQTGLNKLEQLKNEVEVLIKYQSDIDKNKDFEYTVNEEIVEKISIPQGQYITNCLSCNRTCHEVCGIHDDRRKRDCWAMTDGYCRICPSKCYWDLHKNFPYKYVPKIVQKVKTAEDLRKRYQEAKDKKLSAEQLVLKVEDEFEAVQIKVLGLTEEVRKSIERLKEIALKPNPLSMVEYIDILIESEKAGANPGWQSRVTQLQNVRKEAEYLKKVADEGFDPFAEYKKKIDQEKKENEKGIWSEVSNIAKNLLSKYKK